MIIAVDFDGTLCSNAYPNIGDPNENLIKSLIDARNNGDKVILWTCRVGEMLDEAISWCHENGLDFDAVNKNVPSVIFRFGSDTRKIYADKYIDDKAVPASEYRLPYSNTRFSRIRRKRG